LSLQQGELYRGAKLSYSTSERLLNAQGLYLQNEQLLEKIELREQARSHFGIGTPLLPVAPKTQRLLVEKKKERQHQAASID